MKIKKVEYKKIFMDLATSLSKLSKCKRLKVGVVITSADYKTVECIGFNGMNSTARCGGRDKEGTCGCAHAEWQSVMDYAGPMAPEKVAFITHSPCHECATALAYINARTVYYKKEYRDLSGIGKLKRLGYKVIKYDGA